MKILTVLGILSALLWGYLIGTLQPRVYTSRQIMEAICKESVQLKTDDWRDACGLAQSVSGERFKDTNFIVVKEEQ